MRLVDKAELAPFTCAALPYQGNSTNTRGFIDTGAQISGFEQRVYVSVPAVEVMATLLGWMGPVELERRAKRHDKLAQRVKELEAECDRLAVVVDAVDIISRERAPRRAPASEGVSAFKTRKEKSPA